MVVHDASRPGRARGPSRIRARDPRRLGRAAAGVGRGRAVLRTSTERWSGSSRSARRSGRPSTSGSRSSRPSTGRRTRPTSAPLTGGLVTAEAVDGRPALSDRARGGPCGRFLVARCHSPRGQGRSSDSPPLRAGRLHLGTARGRGSLARGRCVRRDGAAGRGRRTATVEAGARQRVGRGRDGGPGRVPGPERERLQRGVRNRRPPTR